MDGVAAEVVARVLDGARCRDQPAELFFGPDHEEGRRERLDRERRAKALCLDCPALIPCREYALQQLEPYGVWGGLGEQERRLALVRAGRCSPLGS